MMGGDNNDEIFKLRNLVNELEKRLADLENIYVVTYHYDSEGEDVMGVYSTEMRANAIARAIDCTSPDCVNIHKFELDAAPSHSFERTFKDVKIIRGRRR